MTQRALGRLPHDPDRPVLRLGHYLKAAPQQQPVEFPPDADYLSNVHDWGLYTNDQFGVCGPTAVANQRKQVSAYLGGAEQSPTLDDVYTLYRTQNPDFDPNTGAGDRGVVLADMLSALLRDGIGGVKPLAYAAVDPESFEEVHAAIGLFGSVLMGVTLQTAQQTQTDATHVWDYKRSATWGGHCVMAGGYTGDTGRGEADIEVVTWGEVVGTTDKFCDRQLDEAWVVLWPEVLGTDEFLDGVDLASLARDYEALTGRPFPALPQPTPPAPPAPVPPPSPVPRDSSAALAAELGKFLPAAQRWLDDYNNAGGAR